MLVSVRYSKEQFEEAKNIVRNFVNGEHRELWDTIVIPVLTCLGCTVTESEREYLPKQGGDAIRAEFLWTKNQKAKWDAMKGKWPESDIERIVHIILESANVRPANTDLAPEEPTLSFKPDPLDENVIYIGRAIGVGITIRSRLNGFETTAHTGKDAHSAGWKYCTEIYPGDALRTNRFYNTYCCWVETEDALDAESTLIEAYVAKHGRLPRLNNQRPQGEHYAKELEFSQWELLREREGPPSSHGVYLIYLKPEETRTP